MGAEKSRHELSRVVVARILLILCASVVQIYAQDFRAVAPGVEYAQVKREFSGQAVSMNFLRLDLTKVRLDVVHANDAAIGTETVSSMAKRHNAFAAINGGFFRDDGSIWAGDPAGVLQIGKRLLSDPIKDRIALLIFDEPRNQLIHIERVRTPNLEAMISPFTSVKIAGINRERNEPNDIVLYTPEFHRTTQTNNHGVEIVVRRGIIDHIEKATGNADIPADGIVISVTGTTALLFSGLKKGQEIHVCKPGIAVFELKRHGENVIADDVTNGVPQLIKNGKVDITWEQEKTNLKFVETRHPRTAVAKLSDGKFLMVTVDGRSESSGGIGLFDLADYLLTLGATDAMNLDGGGSTTMYLDGNVVNHPSDPTGERKVSDAILVTLRKPAKKK